MALSEGQFYDLWVKFANSDLIESLPDDVEKEAEKLGITVDYYIAEFM
jgi:hypothetical protein